MALVLSPIVLNTAFPIVRACVKAVYQTDCRSSTCVESAELCVPQHDTRRIDISFVNSVGIGYDVTPAAEISFIIASNVRSAPLLTKLKSNGGIVITGNTLASIELSSAETGSLPARSLYYECRIVAPNGNIATVLSGTFKVQDTRIGDS